MILLIFLLLSFPACVDLLAYGSGMGGKAANPYGRTGGKALGQGWVNELAGGWAAQLASSLLDFSLSSISKR